MNMRTLNIWAILAASISAFVIGGLWYSPFLLSPHMEAAGQWVYSPPRPRGRRDLPSLFFKPGGGVPAFAMFLSTPTTTLAFGATAGFLAERRVGGHQHQVVAVFEHRPLKYVLINGGYLTVALTVMGAILGGWR
jgi:hypothetical protein